MNLLRAARSNPKLSAYAYIEGQFDYNKTPLVPPETRIIAHEVTNQCSTLDPNCEDSWSIDLAPEHYKCIRCYFPKTRSKRDIKTVTFSPHVIPFLKVNTDDFLRQATNGIIKLLAVPLNNILPVLEAGDITSNAILKVAKILNRTDKIPAHTPSSIENKILSIDTTVKKPNL